jgi:hypothetical protein
LKNYKNPFTILVDKEKLTKNKTKKSQDILESIEKLDNKKIYKKIAFRVAHNFMHRKLIRI